MTAGVPALLLAAGPALNGLVVLAVAVAVMGCAVVFAIEDDPGRDRSGPRRQEPHRRAGADGAAPAGRSTVIRSARPPGSELRDRRATRRRPDPGLRGLPPVS